MEERETPRSIRSSSIMRSSTRSGRRIESTLSAGETQEKATLRRNAWPISRKSGPICARSAN